MGNPVTRRESCGQLARSIRSVASATSPFPRGLASWASAEAQRRSGIRAIASRTGSVRSKPTEKPIRPSRTQSNNPCVAPAESKRSTISESAAMSAGSCSSASSATSILVGHRVGAGVARAQQPGQRLPAAGVGGTVEEGEHRVEAVAAVERPCRSLLLGARLDQGRRTAGLQAPRRRPRRAPRSAPISAGSPGRRSRIGARPLESASVSPIRSAVPASSAVPEWETTPSPSAVTSTVNSGPLRCTFLVILLSGNCEL